METELRAKAARKIALLIELAIKLEGIYGEGWEYTPNPSTCHVFMVYNRVFKESNALADEIERK